MTRKPLDCHSLFPFADPDRADDPAIVLLRGGAQFTQLGLPLLHAGGAQLVDQADQGFVDRRDADKAEDVALQILDAVAGISPTPNAAKDSLG